MILVIPFQCTNMFWLRSNGCQLMLCSSYCQRENSLLPIFMTWRRVEESCETWRLQCMFAQTFGGKCARSLHLHIVFSEDQHEAEIRHKKLNFPNNCHVHVQTIYSIMNGNLSVHANLLLLVTTLCFQFFNHKVLHYWTMQVTLEPKTKLLLSSMWDVILDIGKWSCEEWVFVKVSERSFGLCTEYKTCVCLYGCVSIWTCVWPNNLF